MDGQSSLYDPMCGSGTILCEAVMKACRIPAGYLRKNFGFQFLPDFDARLWERIKKEEDGKIGKLPSGLVAEATGTVRQWRRPRPIFAGFRGARP